MNNIYYIINNIINIICNITNQIPFEKKLISHSGNSENRSEGFKFFF